MRKKTTEKREQIINVASKLFLKKGFDGISMDLIAKTVGGSKATLYSYFKKKEDIFIEVVLNFAQKLKGDKSKALESSDDFPVKLKNFALEHLNFMLSPKMVSVRRLVIVQGQSAIGQAVYERGFKACWQTVEEIIIEAVKEGALKKDIHTWVATMHLKGLIEADLIEKSMLCSKFSITPHEISKAVEMGVNVFLTYYGSKERE
ncbi:MAG TPA: TetR/AcrR family transcriptional regulator [Alphaproteobacteria bacterium]|nr:TetR/AcrR family transcriptional regulator [Alphaproteobacteria bacterium]